MPAGFEIQYRQAVLEQDLLRLPRNVRTRVIRAVETRLVTEPQKYGQRLRRSLLGLWKLRVGDYRIVYAERNPSRSYPP